MGSSTDGALSSVTFSHSGLTSTVVGSCTCRTSWAKAITFPSYVVDIFKNGITHSTLQKIGMWDSGSLARTKIGGRSARGSAANFSRRNLGGVHILAPINVNITGKAAR